MGTTSGGEFGADDDVDVDEPLARSSSTQPEAVVMGTRENSYGGSVFANPWIQLILGIICMASVANLQYGWTWFVDPMSSKFHWTRAEIQVAFQCFVLIETWLVPVEGYLVDRFGPRPVVIAGAVLVAIAWVINSMASSLFVLYVAAVIGGVGTGSVYGTCIGNALKWFPRNRGLAAGITAAGFGAGAALTVIPIKNMIDTSGYQHAFLFFGLLQGTVVLVMAMGLLVAAPSLIASAPKSHQAGRSFQPAQVLRSPCFWVMYLMFVLVAAGGLTLIPNVASIAKDFGIAKTPVDLAGWVLPAAVFAVTLQRIFDGFGRPFFGWVSDHIGRENTMAIAFVIGAIALYTLAQSGHNPILFVLVTAVYFGAFGEIYSLFPATQGDTFGSQFAAANSGMLYTAKGAGSLLVASATALAVKGGWHQVFMIGVVFNLIAAALGMLVLKPMRARHLQRTRTALDTVGAHTG
ncbi:MAG TPA: oxalate/formate MFS antiporter [Steroidobacteraceae bacterium]|jgi:OFA family oxalate/formate antiporter-like MFS transporter|nr:oxalate/formate MFS antiporter [Steroidobacteraceae bacterium]